MAPLLGTVLAGVKREDVGIASGLLSTAIQIGIAVGVGLYGMIFYAIAASSSAGTLAESHLQAFELTLLIFFAVEITNFILVFLLPKVSAGRVRDIFLERLPGPLPALALSFYFMSGGRVGRQIFDEPHRRSDKASGRRAEGSRGRFPSLCRPALYRDQ